MINTHYLASFSYTGLHSILKMVVCLAPRLDGSRRSGKRGGRRGRYGGGSEWWVGWGAISQIKSNTFLIVLSSQRGPVPAVQRGTIPRIARALSARAYRPLAAALSRSRSRLPVDNCRMQSADHSGQASENPRRTASGQTGARRELSTINIYKNHFILPHVWACGWVNGWRGGGVEGWTTGWGSGVNGWMCG
jgi:hypothetical protein